MLDGLQDRGISWKAAQAFLGDLLAVHPHAQLAAAARLEIGISPGILLDQRRHPGGARQIVSLDAVANSHPVHRVSVR